jgi:hypothetical protein
MITVSAKGAFTIAEAMIAQAQRMAFAMKCFRYIATSTVAQIMSPNDQASRRAAPMHAEEKTRAGPSG